MRSREVFRWISLAVILGFSVWLFWPERGEEGAAGSTSEAVNTRHENAKYVIRFSVGPFYMPGTIPFGFGKPLDGVNKVVDAFEERYPDTHIEVVNVPVMIREYLVTQLSSGLAPDIIFVNVEDVWVDVQKGWYVPLDKYLEAPNPFVREKGDPAAPGYNQWWDMFKYQAISRGKAGPDGKNYCISYDMVETGIFYNKDIFKEVGVEVPQTWDDFMDIMARIKKAGHLPLIMHLDWFNDWAVDLFIDQLYHDILPGIDLFKDPKREPYLQGYLDWDEIAFLYKKGFFTRRDPRYREVWRIMKELKQYSSENMTTADVVRDFVTGNGAMIWNNSSLTYPLTADPEMNFNWGVFYLPPFTKKTSPYAPDKPEPMCVIGGSATQFEVTNSAFDDTGDPETSEKLKRSIAFLQFLTLPENCETIVDEYSCFIPNIIGVPVLKSLAPFEEILKRRYTTTKFTYTFDLRFTEIQRRALELYLMGGMSLDDLLVWQDENMDAAVRNVMLRKNIDMNRLQQSWDALAPLRAHMTGLPDEK